MLSSGTPATKTKIFGTSDLNPTMNLPFLIWKKKKIKKIIHIKELGKQYLSESEIEKDLSVRSAETWQ